MAKKMALGRGLEALFNDIEIAVPDNSEITSDEENKSKKRAKQKEKEESASTDGILFIDINKMIPNRNQPRKSFDEEKIEELAQSIKMNGLIQPILVRRQDHSYEIVAGERRWRAARKAGLKEIPCIIRDIDEQQNILIALIENVQREDLNILEEAIAFQKMADNFSMTQQEIAESVGKSRPYVTNTLRLLKLPEEIRSCVIEGKLSGGHARTLASLESKEKQISLANQIIEKGLSVRQAEIIAGGQEKVKRAKSRVNPKVTREIKYVEDQLKTALGTKVTIKPGTRTGKIEIEYYNKGELERLIEWLLHQ